MKICLASLHPRRLSGQVESLVALGRELEGLGHTVRLVTAFEAPADAEQIDPVELEAGASARGKLKCMLRGLARLVEVSRDVDVIHLNLPTPAFSWLADLLLLRPGSPPLVVSYEAHLSDVKELVLGGDLFRDPRFYLPLALINNGIWGRLAAYRCQRYVVASRFQRAELVALGVDERRIVTLSNLIDREKLHPLPKQLAQRALLGEALRGPLIGWAGHFHHVKGVDALVEAFDRLSRARPSARLALAWSGIGNRRPVEARIRALGLEQRVVWLRRVDIGCFLAALDVLALPYRRTTGQGAFPNLVLEALAVGVPLVTSRLPLLTELLADSGAALLSPPDDPSAIAASCARLLDEPSVAQAQVTAQRALDLEFSSASLTGRYQELYSEVLAEAARRHEPSRHYARRG